MGKIKLKDVKGYCRKGNKKKLSNYWKQKKLDKNVKSLSNGTRELVLDPEVEAPYFDWSQFCDCIGRRQKELNGITPDFTKCHNILKSMDNILYLNRQKVETLGKICLNTFGFCGEQFVHVYFDALYGKDPDAAMAVFLRDGRKEAICQAIARHFLINTDEHEAFSKSLKRECTDKVWKYLENFFNDEY